MTVAKPSKPDAGRKAGGELPYSPTDKAIGGPNQEQPRPGLGEGSFGTKSNESVPTQPKE